MLPSSGTYMVRHSLSSRHSYLSTHDALQPNKWSFDISLPTSIDWIICYVQRTRKSREDSTDAEILGRAQDWRYVDLLPGQVICIMPFGSHGVWVSGPEEFHNVNMHLPKFEVSSLLGAEIFLGRTKNSLIRETMAKAFDPLKVLFS